MDHGVKGSHCNIELEDLVELVGNLSEIHIKLGIGNPCHHSDKHKICLLHQENETYLTLSAFSV